MRGKAWSETDERIESWVVVVLAVEVSLCSRSGGSNSSRSGSRDAVGKLALFGTLSALCGSNHCGSGILVSAAVRRCCVWCRGVPWCAGTTSTAAGAGGVVVSTVQRVHMRVRDVGTEEVDQRVEGIGTVTGQPVVTVDRYGSSSSGGRQSREVQ